jgi:acetolactate synthase-1/2/3 large subunit
MWTTPDFTGRIEDSWHSINVEEGGEAAEMLLAAMRLGGMERLWFVSGSELTALQEASAKARVLGRPAPQIMTMLHEHAALCAAMGESMISGRPGGACAHVELGLLNMGGAIHIAQRGNFPVLILTGAPSSSYPDSGPGGRSHTVFWRQQIRDQGEIVRQYVKWDYKLAPYDNAGLAATRALQVAMSQPTGPVYMATPRETLQTPIQGVQRFPTLATAGLAGDPAPDPSLLRRAAKILIEAESPHILVERMGRNPAALAPFVELAELLAAKVTAPGFRVNFPQPHPLRVNNVWRGFPVLNEADTLLVIDSPVPWLPSATGPRAGAKVIWIDIDPIVQSIPMWEFGGDIRMTADSAIAVPMLLEEIKRQLTASDRTRLDARRERLFAEGREALANADAAIDAMAGLPHLTPQFVAKELDKRIGNETIVIGEGGATNVLRRDEPGTLFFHGGASLGFAMAACVGGKLAKPDRRFVAMVGDGTYNFSLASQVFWAAKQYKAPFLTMIMNNRGYSTGTLMLREAYPDGFAVKSGNYDGGFFDPPPDYAAEARAAGCFGEQARSPADVGPAIERALRAVDAQGVPAVIDCWLPKHITGEI